jgi:hypothetical protein
VEKRRFAFNEQVVTVEGDMENFDLVALP